MVETNKIDRTYSKVSLK